MKIIFIIVDCMRWDYLSGNGYPRPTTPNLDRIANNSSVFDRAYTTINQTDQSLTSIFSGSYPLTHGLGRTAASMSRQELASANAWHMRYLPQMLQDAGFATFGVDWLDRWHQWGYDWYWSKDNQRSQWLVRSILSPFARLALSFVRSIKLRGVSLAQLATMKPGVDAITATKQALSLLKQHRDRDVFLMLHYWDVHAPYRMERKQFLDEMRSLSLPGEKQDPRDLVEQLCRPDGYKQWLLTQVVRDATTIGELITQHCAALRVVDEQIGRIYKFIEDDHLMDQTVFVITADHGENLFEPGYSIEHSGVRENVMRVPLIMRFPGIEPSRVDQVVSHVDIVSTLVDYLRLGGFSYFDGLSLLPLMIEQKTLARRSVYFQTRLTEPGARWGIVNGRYKYMERIQATVSPCKYCGRQHAPPPTELYDLVEDRWEQNNLAESHPDLSSRLSTDLKQLSEDLTRKSALIASKNLESMEDVYSESEKAELEEHLRSLGYFE